MGELTTQRIKDYKVSYNNTRRYVRFGYNHWFQHLFDSGFEVSVYFGLGIRINEIRNSLTTEEIVYRTLGDWNNPTNYIQKNGFSYSLATNLGIKTGYRF